MAKPKRERWMCPLTPAEKAMAQEIARQRVINGIDQKQRPMNEIVRKTFKWPPMIDMLKKAKFVDDDKGQVFNVFNFIVIAFLAVVFFGGLIYAQGKIYNVLQTVGLQNEVNAGNPGYTNMTLANDMTIGVINQSIQALRMVAVVYILCLGATIIITNAIVKTHPLFFFAYVLICALAVIFSVPIANAYNTLLTSGIFENLLPSFTGANFLVLNLPAVTLVISLLGGIFLFINLIRTDSQGEIRLQ